MTDPKQPVKHPPDLADILEDPALSLDQLQAAFEQAKRWIWLKSYFWLNSYFTDRPLLWLFLALNVKLRSHTRWK